MAEATKRIVLFGAPGSGKGTQAERLQKEFGIPHISTGDILRDAVRRGTELGRKAEPIMKSGDLVSDELMNAIVAERLEQDDVQKGFILDGYPRTLDQAREFNAIFEGNEDPTLHVFYLSVPDQVIVGRVAERLSCPKCKAIYHRKNSPPREEGVCDRCGAVLVSRSDDQEADAVRRRLEEYHRQTMPVVDFYREKGMLREIDGLGGIDEIFEQIRKLLTA
ncbi:MAG: adenylate kinase [Thermoanaerobaculia bacterium]|nr:adenylate kinase [Thermoanaerobaculia bacterium]